MLCETESSRRFMSLFPLVQRIYCGDKACDLEAAVRITVRYSMFTEWRSIHVSKLFRKNTVLAVVLQERSKKMSHTIQICFPLM